MARRAVGEPDRPVKEVQAHVAAAAAAAAHAPQEPPGIKGKGPIAFGTGHAVGKRQEALLRETDPAQYAAAAEAPVAAAQ